MIFTLLVWRLIAFVSERRGNAAAELAIAAPFLITLGTGALSMAVHLDGYLEAQHIANAAARMQASGADLANPRVQSLLLTAADSGYLIDVKTYAPGPEGGQLLAAIRFGDTEGIDRTAQLVHAEEAPLLPVAKAEPTTVVAVYFDPSTAGFPSPLSFGILRATAAY